MSVTTPTRDQLQRALVIAEQIHKLEQELAGILNSSAPVVAATASPKPRGGSTGKRYVSPEARAKMAAAQAARWARARGNSAGAATATSLKAAGGLKKGKKRVLSAEGRARIVAALKARHAANRATKGR
jgi:hypothetical protein